MKWPPKREEAPPSAPLPNPNHRSQSKARRAIAQPCWLAMRSDPSAWRGWAREALRLFSLWWNSGDQKHFQAFGRHCDAMRIRARRGN
jgi:hypothetical protein